MTAVRGVIAVLLAVLLTPVALTSAHTNPVASSSPERGAVVSQATEVEIVFTDAIRPDFATFTLRSSDGQDHALEPIGFSDGDARAVLTPRTPLPDGLYRAGYQVVFGDGHAAAGVIQFEVSADGIARAEGWPVDDQAGPQRPEPERVDVTGIVPYVIGGAVVVVAGVVALGLRARRRDRAVAATTDAPSDDARPGPGPS